MLQAQNERRAGQDLRSRDGHRVLVRGGNGVRVAHTAEDRSRPHTHDAGVGAVAANRLLPHARPRLHERPLPITMGPAEAVHCALCYRRTNR